MKEPLGTVVGLAICVLIYDVLRGKLDASSHYRATVAFMLSLGLLLLLAGSDPDGWSNLTDSDIRLVRAFVLSTLRI